jgi:hypothetical protein
MDKHERPAQAEFTPTPGSRMIGPFLLGLLHNLAAIVITAMRTDMMLRLALAAM